MKSRRRASGLTFLLLPLAFLLLSFTFLAPTPAEGNDLTVDNGQTLTVPPSIAYDNEYIGYGGVGTLIQTSGTNTVGTSAAPGNLYLGDYPVYAPGNSGAIGTYNLGGPVSGSTLTVTGTENIGYNGGTGTFNQTGGTNTAGVLDVWYGTYILSGGSLKVGFEYLDSFFTQTGGTTEVSGDLFAGGTYTQSGGSNTVDGSLSIGAGNIEPGGGKFELSGGDLTVKGDESIGLMGPSTFTQTGGTNTVIGNMEMAGQFSQSGGVSTVGGSLFMGGCGLLCHGEASYELSGGSLTVKGGEYMGGIFIQSGGINTVGGPLGVGTGSSYELSNGALAVNDGEYVGLNGAVGGFTQTGGSNTVFGGLVLANGSSYSLSGGSLAVAGGETVESSVAPSSAGFSAFTQTGGTNTVSGGLALTNGSSYSLSGGILTVAGGETVENSVVPNLGGVSAFTQTGGGNTVTGGLEVLNGASYILSGGSLTVAGGESVDSSSAFTQTGGINTVTGGVDMNGGTYTLGGGVLSADAISGNLDNKGGTFIPAVQAGAGVNLTGDYTQSAPGRLQINIVSEATYGRLNANGVATINGGEIDPVLQNGYVPSQGQVFSGVLKASSGIAGTFGSVGNFTPTMVDEIVYTPDSVDLVAVRDYANSKLTLTSNQRQVANVLNSASETTTGDLGTVLHDIDGLGTSGQVACAFQQISPDMAASLANLGFAASDAFRQDLTQRITNLRYGAVDGGDTGLGGAKSPLLAMGPSGLSSLLADVGSDGQAHNFGGVGVYVDPLVSWGTQSSTPAESGYDFSLGGFAAGIDLRLTDDFLAGVSTGYAHTDAGLAANEGQVGNDTVPVTFYTAYTPPCPFYAFGAVGYAANSFDMNRQIAFGGIDRAALSSTTGNQFNAYGEAGYDLRAGRLVFSPVVDLFYSSLWIDGFFENGADALDLNVASQHADSFQACPGIKVATLIRNGRAVIAPQLYATYAHEFSNDSRGLDASLNGIGTPFTFQTQQLGRNFAVVGASLTMFSGKNFSVQLDSNAELGRDNYAAYTVDAGLRFHF